MFSVRRHACKKCIYIYIYNIYIVYKLCHVNDCVFLDKMAGFRAQTAVSSILPHRSLGSPIDIFPVTVTSVHAVEDLTGKM